MLDIRKFALVNLGGGPGTGKSTSASHLFAELKMEGVLVELVGEEAKDLIYDGSIPLLENQVYVLGRQWQRIMRLKNAGVRIAISDSPLAQTMLYTKDKAYHEEMTALVRKLERQIPETYNVFIRRVKPYVKLGRYQDEDGAKALDAPARELIQPIWAEVDGNRHGVHELAGKILREIL